MADRAKVFWSGRSQAVRLPKEYRFDTGEVTIRREGRTVVLDPGAIDEWAWLKNRTHGIDEDFAAAVEEDPGEQQRPALDDYFK